MAQQLIADLADLFPEAVLVEPCTGEDALGARTYGTAVSRACRITQRVQRVNDMSGQERVSHLNILLAGDFGYTVKDRYTLPARFAPSSAEVSDVTKRQPVAVSVAYASDENGPHHQRIYF